MFTLHCGPVRRILPPTIVTSRPRSRFIIQMVVILAAGALLLVQLALIIALLRQRASRLRAEREVQRVREHLAHLTRVSAMGELAASMAHELNQPLTGILANARAAGHLLARADVPV